MLKVNTGMKRLGYFIAIAIIIVAFSSPSYGEQVNENKKTLLFLGNENIPPLIYNDHNNAKGLIVDLIKELSKKISYDIEVEAINWQEAQSKVLSGKADALLHFNPSPEREELYDFSTGLLKSEFSIFKKSGDLSISDISDLENKKVGVELLGYPRYLLEAFDGITIVTIQDWVSGFEMIESGSLDLLVADKWIGEYALAKSKVSDIQVIQEPIETRYSYIAVRKGNEELLKHINKGLKEMKSDGSMEKILNKWSGENIVYFTKNQIKKAVFYMLLGISALVIMGSTYLVTQLRRTNHELELMVEERTKELYEANKKLKKISKTDGLTNISNRRHFNKIFEKAWKRSLRKKQPLSLILLDIDHFKQCNDTYGHLAGDCCLEAMAHILQKSVKGSRDAVARFGGEEFVIMLFNTAEESALMLAKQIRKTVENEVVDYEGQKIRFTASLGVATLIPNTELVSTDLIRLADEAMYQAKENGRNQVVMSDAAHHI